MSLFSAETTRREAMAAMAAAFRKAGVDDPAGDARYLLCAAAEIDHAALIRDPGAPLEEEACGRLEEYAARRVAREPATRILGTRGFWSLDLAVAPGVLDPRPDSEAIIDAALKFLGERQNAPLAIADLGSGSGALLCALLDVFEKASGLAVDVSEAARALSARNLAACGFSARARVMCRDWSEIAKCAITIPLWRSTAARTASPPFVRWRASRRDCWRRAASPSSRWAGINGSASRGFSPRRASPCWARNATSAE